MLKVFNLPAFWGFWGSLIYAAGRLTSVLTGEARDHPEAVRRAWLQFGVAIMFGPVAAQALGPQVLDWIGHHTRPEATYFAIGLSINCVWPTIEQMAWPSIMAWCGQQLQNVGKAMSAAEPPKAEPGDEQESLDDHLLAGRHDRGGGRLRRLESDLLRTAGCQLPFPW